MSHIAHRKVLDCGSPLPLFHRTTAAQQRQRTAAVQDAGAPALLLLFVTILLLSGCATTRHPAPKNFLPHTAELFPPDALVTQRGVLTVRGRQFSLNGYIAKSEARGLRLVMTENFGAVLADVLVKPDGKIFVMRAKPPFRPAWIKDYIAADLRCIFSHAAAADCPGRMLSPTHFVIERRWYKLDLQTVEVKPGAQPAETFDETSGGKK